MPARDLASRARVADRSAHVTWQLLEAEDGALQGDAQIRRPESAWTGESQFSGGAYVELGHRGEVHMSVELPTTDRYDVMPVFWCEPDTGGSLRQRLRERPAGRERLGGAGPRGVTPLEGYLDLGSGGTRVPVAAGDARMKARAVDAPDDVRLDAALVQPDLEWLMLEGDNQAQGLLRSFARRTRQQSVSPAVHGDVIARSYDDRGRLVDVASGRGGRVRATVAPGRFTIIRTTRDRGRPEVVGIGSQLISAGAPSR